MFHSRGRSIDEKKEEPQKTVGNRGVPWAR